MASRIVRFTVKKGEVGQKSGWDTCVVQRGVARALKINVERVAIGYSIGTVYNNNGVSKQLHLFPRTQKLRAEHDSGQVLTPGVYSVKIVDVK